jgi:glycosyltransferase involved in cell wall biosynthesis
MRGNKLIGVKEPDKKLINNQINSANRVFFWGRADRNEMKRLMKGCELFVVPSRKEPFGIVALEAFASGKKVVATNTGGLTEIIKDRINGYSVKAVNAEALAKGIKKAISDKTESIPMNLSENTWQNISRKYLKIFQRNFTSL